MIQALLAPLAAHVATGLTAAVATMAGRALIALGVGVVSYTGIEIMLSQTETYVYAQLAGIPAETMAILSYLGVTAAIQMHFSAVAGIAGVRLARKSFGVLSK
ncbi:DUF2523 family protein [Chitinimonas taiwanensis]|uniref:DUF2523 domain-containing protein n=1 Tax=Chitinimonas taiwanensis DSM 18899 TaxID=1121279 RepID=A0A1K2HDS8_9NEIS|nr:DUF2523 family protein [Chitinimonas taiwanensis]SFZ74919.1 Protein of unknown function [Chitinimonas taiwanensis DSM 18899]